MYDSDVYLQKTSDRAMSVKVPRTNNKRNVKCESKRDENFVLNCTASRKTKPQHDHPCTTEEEKTQEVHELPSAGFGYLRAS